MRLSKFAQSSQSGEGLSLDIGEYAFMNMICSMAVRNSTLRGEFSMQNLAAFFSIQEVSHCVLKRKTNSLHCYSMGRLVSQAKVARWVSHMESKCVK